MVKILNTPRQIQSFTQYNEALGLFTCCGFEGCVRDDQINEGILIAVENGAVCPCGKYKQDIKVKSESMLEDFYKDMATQWPVAKDDFLILAEKARLDLMRRR